jgi:hypothetical protein
MNKFQKTYKSDQKFLEIQFLLDERGFPSHISMGECYLD